MNLSILVFALVVVASLTSVVSSPWLAVAAGAVVGLGISALFQRRVKHLHVALLGPDTVAAGDSAEYAVRVTNHADTRTPPFALVISPYGCLPVTMYVERLIPRASCTVTVPVTAGVRTDVRRAVVEVHSSDPLALLHRITVGTAALAVPIHPPRVTAQRIRAHGLGDIPKQSQTNRPGEEFAGVRPWRRGDSRRAIDWRSTARRSRLIVVERLREQSTGLAVVVVGNPETVDDELVLANAAAVALDVLNRRDPLQVLGWTGMGMSQASLSSPRQLSTWFAQPFGIPDAAGLWRLAPWVGTVALAATAATSAGWRAHAEAELQGSGRTVVWLDAAALDDHRREVMQQMIELSRQPAGTYAMDPGPGGLT